MKYSWICGIYYCAAAAEFMFLLVVEQDSIRFHSIWMKTIFILYIFVLLSL